MRFHKALQLAQEGDRRLRQTYSSRRYHDAVTWTTQQLHHRDRYRWSNGALAHLAVICLFIGLGSSSGISSEEDMRRYR